MQNMAFVLNGKRWRSKIACHSFCIPFSVSLSSINSTKLFAQNIPAYNHKTIEFWQI